MQHFADRLIKAIKRKGNPICVGLDPRLKQIPKFIQKKYLAEYPKDHFKAAAKCLLEFNKGIIDAVCDVVPVVKPQKAFYELYGAEGIKAFEDTVKYAHEKGLIVVADGKRNDIGSTAEAYAKAYLGKVDLFGKEEFCYDVDALTVNPYLGYDGIKPFIEQGRKFGKGIFVLVKTSNPSSGDLQDLRMKDERMNYEIIANLVESWGADEIGDEGYSSVGVVVGATFKNEACMLRKVLPQAIFLVPGYGAQGGGAEDVKVCFNKDGLGAIVNSSRGIIFAYEKSKKFGEEEYAEAARAAAEEMSEELGK